MKDSLFKLTTVVACLLFGLEVAADAQDNKKDKANPAAADQDAPTAVKKAETFQRKRGEQAPVVDAPDDIAVLLEYISVEHRTANELLSEFTAKAGGVDELRDRLEEMLDEETAELVETVWLRCRKGQRAETQSVLETIYPTEWDPPNIPDQVGGVLPSASGHSKKNPNAPNGTMTHGNPAAFETREVGSLLEIEPGFSEDGSLIYLNLYPQLVERLEQRYFTRDGAEETARGISSVSMPTFYSIKNTAEVEVAPGRYNLLGIHAPHDDAAKRILVLLRADVIALE